MKDYIIHKTHITNIISQKGDDGLNSILSDGYKVIFNEAIELEEGVFVFFYLSKEKNSLVEIKQKPPIDLYHLFMFLIIIYITVYTIFFI